MQARISERIIPFLATLACIGWLTGATAPAHAEIVRVIGASLRVHNPDGPQVVTVRATFLGDPSSLFTSELYLDAPTVDALGQPTFLGPIFNNHTTPLDATATLGTFLPETVLYIRNRSFFLPNPSDPSSPASYNFNFFTGDGTLPPNPDRLPHAVFSFDAAEPNGPVTVSFEDIFGGGDLDFNDAVYSFANVRAALVDVAVTPIVNVGQSTAFARFDDYYRNEATIENSGLIINYGSGDNSGLLSNLGSLLNDIPGTLLNSEGGRIDNQGDFGSFGSLFNQGEIRNSGALNNAGFLENAGSMLNEAAGTLRNLFTGAIENIGSWWNEGEGRIDNDGSIENSGTIRNIGDLSNASTGTLRNSVGGAIENLGNWFNSAGGSIENTGTIDNSGTIRSVGTLTNGATGTVRNGVGGAIENLGNWFNSAGGSIENNGTIDNSGTLRSVGTLTNGATGTVRNLVAGTIENIGNWFNGTGSTVENRGSLQNSGIIQNVGTFTNETTGSVRNAIGGAIDNLGEWFSRSGSSVESDGSIANSGSLIISAQSSVSGSGTYSQSSGSTVVDGVLGASTIDILGGVLSGSGVVQGEVRIGPGGTLAPGNSPGTLQILGDFHLDGGRIAIELAALALHDVLDISGAAVFNGGFIDYLFSFTPAAGDSFVFLTALGGIGGFETLSFNFFGDLGGLRFATLQVGNSLVLKVEPGATSVPVPGVIWLMAPALLILVIDARRRGRRAGR